MTKFAIKLAVIALVLLVSVPIFKTQINIKKLKAENAELEEKIALEQDKLDYAKEKLERIKNGDEDVLKECARDELGYFDPNEEIIYNDSIN